MFKKTNSSAKILLLMLVVLIFASTGLGAKESKNKEYTQKEEALVNQWLSSLDAKYLGEIRTTTFLKMLADLSVLKQEKAWLDQISKKAHFLGGLGHFSQNEDGYGVLFVSLDVALIAATIASSYALLPPQVKFDSLDYFGASRSQVNAAWDGLSFLDLLPSLAAWIGGSVLRSLYLELTASHANDLAKEKLADGRIKFDARPYFLVSGDQLQLGIKINP